MLKVKNLMIIIEKSDNNTLSKYEVKGKYATIIKL